MTAPRLVTASAAAKLLECSRWQAYKLLAKYEIPAALVIGPVTYYDADLIERLVPSVEERAVIARENIVAAAKQPRDPLKPRVRKPVDPLAKPKKKAKKKPKKVPKKKAKRGEK